MSLILTIAFCCRPVCDIHPEPILRPRTSADAADVSGAELGAAPEARRSAGVAWGSVAAPSPSSPPAPGGRSESRPLSAGPFHRPCIEPQFVLAQATLPPTDPAVPIISAIKQELERLPTRSSLHPTPRTPPATATSATPRSDDDVQLQCGTFGQQVTDRKNNVHFKYQ